MSYLIYESNNLTKQYKAVIFVNTTSQEAASLPLHFYYQAVMRAALGKPMMNYEVTTTPFPVPYLAKKNLKGTSPYFIVFFVSISFALIPAAMISFIMGEREKNLKHMQLISGMSLAAYWISNMIFDIVKALLPGVITLGFMEAYRLLYPNIWVPFLLYPFAITPFTYVTSFIFDSEIVAQTFTIFLHFVFGGIGPILTFVMRTISSTKFGGDKLDWVLKMVPSFCLTDVVAFQAGKDDFLWIRPDLRKSSDYHITLNGGNLMFLSIHFIFWTIILFLIETSFFSCIRETLI